MTSKVSAKVHHMTTLLPEVVFLKTSWLERQGRLPIAIGAMLVPAWLSTATAAPLDRQVPTKSPESHDLESQAPESQTLRLRFDNGLLSLHASQRSFEEVLGAIRRLHAVSALAWNRQADQETVNTVLNAALTDEDAVVRALAVAMLHPETQ